MAELVGTDDWAGVVGINLPTFVERRTSPLRFALPPSVVGINLPTFVERCRPGCTT